IMKHPPRFAYFIFLAVIVALPPTLAEGWPQYRGPDQEGRSNASGIFPEQGFGLAQAWKRELGDGYSSVLVAGDRLVTMYGDGEANWVVALDAGSGEER
ncbi:MAG: hypothetical protein GTO30_08720, partial [Acidobacteria bacterium]|nr:hypothetical protein [Acidobacteriota bacterium]NIM61720.1 hypothetical protein [Acidobacteriota bacterium]NIO58202.1 hypothetical protein [Acidobacteriota bacterium]NIQ83767.1 hypothetical protein [Acidobacteriota bacterium]NIT09930.1 hypothetical protein [Acidobacteriota bacterium]